MCSKLAEFLFLYFRQFSSLYSRVRARTRSAARGRSDGPRGCFPRALQKLGEVICATTPAASLRTSSGRPLSPRRMRSRSRPRSCRESAEFKCFSVRNVRERDYISKLRFSHFEIETAFSLRIKLNKDLKLFAADIPNFSLSIQIKNNI